MSNGFSFHQVANIRDYHVYDRDGRYLGIVGARSKGWIATPVEGSRTKSADSSTIFFKSRFKAAERLQYNAEPA